MCMTYSWNNCFEAYLKIPYCPLFLFETEVYFSEVIQVSLELKNLLL